LKTSKFKSATEHFFSVVNLDGLLHVVVACPLRVLVDVLQPDVRPGARLARVGVLRSKFIFFSSLTVWKNKLECFLLRFQSVVKVGWIFAGKVMMCFTDVINSAA
jgi:hypothetical protein